MLYRIVHTYTFSIDGFFNEIVIKYVSTALIITDIFNLKN